jgi:hypothetical protein
VEDGGGSTGGGGGPDQDCGGDEQPPCPPHPVEDPILLDVDGNGFQLTSTNGGVKFDFFGTGKPVQTSWTAPNSGDAWLVLDVNGNGKIDSGREMLGNVFEFPKFVTMNGFEALASYDMPENGGNGDGIIDSRDAVYPKLLLWIDQNHNGIAEPGELFTLASKGILYIDLNYRSSPRRDQYGNQFRYRAKIGTAKGDGTAKYAYDVILKNPGAVGPSR